MKSSVDFHTYSVLKEKRTKSLKEKTKKKGSHVEESLETILSEKNKGSFKQKPLKEFRNNQKNFEYDYEEDPYEPDYDSYEY